jgi:hypothetical protein
MALAGNERRSSQNTSVARVNPDRLVGLERAAFIELRLSAWNALVPVEPGIGIRRKESGRVVAETVPDGGARSTTRKMGEGRV